MITQVVFKIDKKLKQAAQKRAKNKGMTLSGLYQQVTRSFVAGKLDLGIDTRPEIPNARTARLLRQIDKDIKAGRNLSPGFENVEDLISSLESDEH